ncbi:MAG: adenosine kinase [Alphaproteobacteria bacterium]|nr:adenosine kinase [Alphaproteobacteria bacterium]
MYKKFDVLGIGNAIVDILYPVTDTYLEQNNLIKGTMRLITEEESKKLYAGIGEKKEISGGSAANTIAALSSLSMNCAYIGVVRDDPSGKSFREGLTGQNVHFETAPRKKGLPTACSFILITPDGERTMNTFLGICNTLEPEDIDPELIKSSKIIYLEGYLFDPPLAKQAFYKAADLARKANNKVALTLSDAFCVDRHRHEFLDFIKNKVDILFANEMEITALYETESFEEACKKVRSDAPMAALTRSEKGSVIITGDQTHSIPAQTLDQVIDLTGAGDIYAAGFLCGYTRQLPLYRAAMLGNICAADIISQIGARSENNLLEKAITKGFHL